MRRFVVTARLRRGSAAKVRELLREGPPFDLEQTPLERHLVFVSDDELVLLFEGPRADKVARSLLRDPSVLGQAGRFAPHLRGRPRLPEEVFGWTRPRSADGVSFGPLPGPGDSEGGGADL